MTNAAVGNEGTDCTDGGAVGYRRFRQAGWQTVETGSFPPMLAGDEFGNQRCRRMSTFYLLPPRPFLAQRYTEFLKPLFPGLDWSRLSWVELAETVTGLAGAQPDVYVVFREDLPEGEEPGRALVEGFGATRGDEVVEVRASATQRWQIG